ncbi:MAG: hypothetical protein JSV53_12405 [candidate division WOR-3 bacterium]|nr:MAG: hypothetical protein JSV53_12405 [candidate division WOR-3 bacterium]
MLTFFLVGLLVYQNGDTLQFKDDTTVVDIIILENSQYHDTLKQIVVRQGKVSEDNKHYLIYEAVHRDSEEVLQSKIAFYDAGNNLLWVEQTDGERNISYDFSGIYNGHLVITVWDRMSSYPDVSVIKDGEKIKVIKKDDWQQLVDYRVSPNGRYILFHTRNPHGGKTWDYLHFYDLDEMIAWDYLFPVCISCKRGRIFLSVDDDGRSECVYKGEHRVFSKDGILEEIFMKIQ